MIFRVCEHYDDEQPIDDEYCDKECFICFEFKSSKGLKTINLIDQTIYLNECICNGRIHDECLQLWFNTNSSCPICRNRMIEINDVTIIMFSYIPYGISVYFFMKKITLRILHLITIFMFLYGLIDFYLTIIGTRYSNTSILDDERYI